jgi:hypothetical protein
VRRALGLSQDMYNLLLYVHDKTSGSLSPVQREQTERFERMLLEDVAMRFLGENGEPRIEEFYPGEPDSEAYTLSSSSSLTGRRGSEMPSGSSMIARFTLMPS